MDPREASERNRKATVVILTALLIGLCYYNVIQKAK